MNEFHGEDSNFPAHSSSQESKRNLFSFFLFGLINNFFFVFIITAAEDLLKNMAGVILMCTIVPGMMSKFTMQFWLHKVPFSYRVMAVGFTNFICGLGLANATSIHFKLGFIVVGSALASVGEPTFLALSSYYSPAAMSMWSSGTGGAGIFGSAAYIFLTSFPFHFSSRMALIISSPVSFMLLVIYFLILEWKHPPKLVQNRYAETSSNGWSRLGSDRTTRSNDEHVFHQSIMSTNSVARMDSNEEQELELRMNLEARYDESREKFSFKDLINLIINYVVPLATVYYAEYVINQGILPTFDRFPKSAALNPSLYPIYQFIYQVAVFISRSSTLLFTIDRIWIFPILQFFNLGFFFVAAIYEFVPSKYLIFAVVFWEGLLGGGAYSNSFLKVLTDIPEGRKERAVTIVSFGDGCGITLASITDTFLECYIRKKQGQHCASS